MRKRLSVGTEFGVGSGRPKGLSEEEREQLHRALLRGRKALGLPAGPWRTLDIRRIVAFFFGTRLGASSIGTLLSKMGWKRLGAGDTWESPRG